MLLPKKRNYVCSKKNRRQQQCIIKRSRWAPFDKASSECPFEDPRDTHSVAITGYTKKQEQKEKLLEMYEILEDHYEEGTSIILQRLIYFLNSLPEKQEYKAKLKQVFRLHNFDGTNFTTEPDLARFRTALSKFLTFLSKE